MVLSSRCLVICRSTSCLNSVIAERFIQFPRLSAPYARLAGNRRTERSDHIQMHGFRYERTSPKHLCVVNHVRVQDGIRLIKEGSFITTRRSAGIPALIVGTLSSASGDALFDSSVRELLKIAQERPQMSSTAPKHLQQVHAMNSLKALFTTTKLAAKSETYIVPGMNVAIRGMQSQM